MHCSSNIRYEVNPSGLWRLGTLGVIIRTFLAGERHCAGHEHITYSAAPLVGIPPALPAPSRATPRSPQHPCNFCWHPWTGLPHIWTCIPSHKSRLMHTSHTTWDHLYTAINPQALLVTNWPSSRVANTDSINCFETLKKSS